MELLPLMASRSTVRLVRTCRHPEWILRTTDKGLPANSANCGKWFYGLDVTNVEVQAFIRDTLTTVSHGAWWVNGG